VNFIDHPTTQILAPASLYYWLTNGMDHIWTHAMTLKGFFTRDVIQTMDIQNMPETHIMEERTGSIHAPHSICEGDGDSSSSTSGEHHVQVILPLDDFCMRIKEWYEGHGVEFSEEELSFLLHFCHAGRVLGIKLWIPLFMTWNDLYLKNKETDFFTLSAPCDSLYTSSSSSHVEEVQEEAEIVNCFENRATQTSPVCSSSPELTRMIMKTSTNSSMMTPGVRRRLSSSDISEKKKRECSSDEEEEAEKLKRKWTCEKCKNCVCQGGKISPPLEKKQCHVSVEHVNVERKNSGEVEFMGQEYLKQHPSSVMIFNIKEWHSSGPVGRD